MQLTKFFIGSIMFVSLFGLVSQNIEVLADNPVTGTEVTFEKDDKGNVIKVISKNQRRISVYNSVDAGDTKSGASVALDADFIDDKNSAEMGLILTIDAFIPSGLKFINGYKPYPSVGVPHPSAGMLWPERYGIEVDNIPMDKKTKIVTATPNNVVKDKQVSNTISYGFGGSVSVDGKKLGMSIESNLAYSKTITYDQPDYETIQHNKTTTNVLWKTTFVETRDEYKTSSWKPIYGNQMFMVGRHSNVSAINNIKRDGEVSSLISGGFSPKIGIVLASPNGTKKSQIIVSAIRISDMYIMRWSGLEWSGENEPIQGHVNEYLRFEIDWEQRTVRHI